MLKGWLNAREHLTDTAFENDFFSDLLMTMINRFECFFMSVNRLSKWKEHVCIQVLNIGNRVILACYRNNPNWER